jgi:hypothetical protein
MVAMAASANVSFFAGVGFLPGRVLWSFLSGWRMVQSAGECMVQNWCPGHQWYCLPSNSFFTSSPLLGGCIFHFHFPVNLSVGLPGPLGVFGGFWQAALRCSISARRVRMCSSCSVRAPHQLRRIRRLYSSWHSFMSTSGS